MPFRFMARLVGTGIAWLTRMRARLALVRPRTTGFIRLALRPTRIGSFSAGIVSVTVGCRVRRGRHRRIRLLDGLRGPRVHRVRALNALGSSGECPPDALCGLVVETGVMTAAGVQRRR